MKTLRTVVITVIVVVALYLVAVVVWVTPIQTTWSGPPEPSMKDRAGK